MSHHLPRLSHLTSIALLAFMLISCGPEKPQTWHLCDNLEAFTTHTPGDTTTLTGIRNRLTGDTMVTPQHFLSIEADSFVVKALMPNKRFRVYSYRGLSIGGFSFDTFSRLRWDETTDFYIGTNYKRSYYYFPKRRKLIEITHASVDGNGFTVPDTEGDSLRYDYHGNLVGKRHNRKE